MEYKKGIIGLIITLIGVGLIIYKGGIILMIGIFLILWGNNINNDILCKQNKLKNKC